MSIEKGHLAGILKRIEQRRAILDLAMRKVSIMAGGSPDMIRTIQRQFKSGKQHNVSPHVLTNLARVLKCRRHWLVTGEGQEDQQVDTPFGTFDDEQEGVGALRVAGFVSAGQWLPMDDNVDAPLVTAAVPAAPQYPRDKQYSVVVRGTSINRVAREGDFLIVVDLHPRFGDLVIATRTRADNTREVTAKRYLPHGTEVELRHDSTDSRYTDPKSSHYQPPIRFKAGENREDSTQIEISGVVVAIYRSPV